MHGGRAPSTLPSPRAPDGAAAPGSPTLRSNKHEGSEIIHGSGDLSWCLVSICWSNQSICRCSGWQEGLALADTCEFLLFSSLSPVLPLVPHLRRCRGRGCTLRCCRTITPSTLEDFAPFLSLYCSYSVRLVGVQCPKVLQAELQNYRIFFFPPKGS